MINSALIIGFGSIGQRHTRNLHVLRPQARICVYDPKLDYIPAPYERVTYLDGALKEQPDCVIIASPSEHHLSAAILVGSVWQIPFYLEKPPCLPDQVDRFRSVVNTVFGLPCAAGFQYRYHPGVQALKAANTVSGVGTLSFVAADDLAGRYGPDVDGIMAIHPVDTAHYILGPVDTVEIFSNGLEFRGQAHHARGGVSNYQIRMADVPRESYIAARYGGQEHVYEMTRDSGMYYAALSAWLNYVETGEHDGVLATLEDGLAAMRVLERVKRK